MSLRAFALVIVAGTVSACSGRPATEDVRVGLEAFGPVRYGVTVRQASRALGESLVVEPDEFTEGCTTAIARTLPTGVWFMVVDGIVARVDVHTDSVQTDAGARVGMTEGETQALYGDQLAIEPHPYIGAEGHYLVLDPDPADSAGVAMIFETFRDTVESFRAGHKPPVLWIEGCA